MSDAVTFELEAPPEVTNWRPLVQWILAVPHLIIAQVLGYVSSALSLISFFAVLFTEKIPEGIYNFQVLVLRYRARVTMYAGFTHETYPKFEFAMTRTDPGGDPLRLSVEAPTGWKRTNAFNFILAFPHYIVLCVFGIGAFVLWVVNFFGILFTGKWNQGHRDFIVKVQRYATRVMAYAMMLRNDYPAFGLS
jgi:uncharacterized MAPEG superfamily protein